MENTYFKTLQRSVLESDHGEPLALVEKVLNRVILDSQELFQSHSYLCPPGMKHLGGCRTLKRG